jgi:ADP-dependent NAD(P)H-hydrate dehydratase / NAD(P)H-hydrate epimerase
VAQAARLGACLHATAADLAADEVGQRSLLATDLMPYLCQLLSDQ